jgi:hypothetical protein
LFFYYIFSLLISLADRKIQLLWYSSKIVQSSPARRKPVRVFYLPSDMLREAERVVTAVEDDKVALEEDVTVDL